MYLIRRTINKLLKLYKWLPILWKDEDWDHYYLGYIIDFKLKQMEQYHEKSQLIDAYKRVTRQIRYARYLIAQLQSDLCEAEWDAHFLTHVRGRTISVPMTEEETQEFWRIHALETKRRAKLQQRLFRHLQTYMTGWWD